MEQAEQKTILVVEDEPDVQVVLVAALRDAGFNVMSASNGHEAYNLVKRQPPDLITLDLVMPRQSGPLLYKKLRSKPKYADVRVMIISAHVRKRAVEGFTIAQTLRGRRCPGASHRSSGCSDCAGR